MMRFSNIAVLTCLLLFSPFAMSLVTADTFLYKKADLSEYQPSEMVLKESLLRVMITSGWEITEQSRFKVKGRYRNVVMEVTVQANGIEMREIPTVPQMEFQERWMDALPIHLKRELEINRQIRIANDLIPK